jgi:hypothetical protein
VVERPALHASAVQPLPTKDLKATHLNHPKAFDECIECAPIITEKSLPPSGDSDTGR